MKEFPQLVIAGWTGRDEAALRKHIEELDEIGIDVELVAIAA